jgi:putative endonuclease
MFWVYIIYSEKLHKYYVGSTNDIDDRLYRHNAGHSWFTSKGCPWRFITAFEREIRAEAVRLEKQIKKRGIARYLESINFNDTRKS